MKELPVDRHIFVVMGATGDLAQRKLFPALYRILVQKKMRDVCQVLGVGTKNISEKAFRENTQQSLEKSGLTPKEVSSWCDSCVHYQSIGKSPEEYSALLSRIKELEQEYNLPGNRVFYLALPPSIFSSVVESIAKKGLNQSNGWMRLVIEKPFGHDLGSAQELNRLIHRYFDESQIFRIDHYLGKETVQNLLIFRFANTIFETLWNRDRVDSVEITVAESLGIENRARYYDQAGALRDIVQNHLAQLLSLVAMEAPAVFTPEDIRSEKVKVLDSIAGIDPENVVFGQYARGKIEGKEVSGYLEEQGITPDSSTETYVALRLEIDNWRWQGVPFYLRTGKRLPLRRTQIVMNFRHPPVCMFKNYSACQVHSNKLLINLQPDEGFHIFFDVKEPDEPLRVRTERLHFHYDKAFSDLPEAYQTLILDILTGDQTLFVRSDEVEASWKLFTPLLKRKIPVYSYDAGTWGPSEADKLLNFFCD